jgi:hypothetical protein
MMDNLGLAGSGGLQAGMILVGSVIPIAILQWTRARGRKATMNSNDVTAA